MQSKAGTIDYKGHEFLELHFRTPTTCDSCNKPMWHMLHPPAAMECRRKSNIQYMQNKYQMWNPKSSNLEIEEKNTQQKSKNGLVFVYNLYVQDLM